MTNDGGNTFEPIFDDQPSLAIARSRLDPDQPGNDLRRDREGNGSDSYYGQGIFKSVNLGITWSQLGIGIFDRVAFTRLAIDSNSPRRISPPQSPPPIASTAPTRIFARPIRPTRDYGDRLMTDSPGNNTGSRPLAAFGASKESVPRR